MLDIALAYNKYAFLGSDFLLWLWWVSEHEMDVAGLEGIDLEETAIITLGNGMKIENTPVDGPKSTITIKGEDSDCKEAMMALAKGGKLKEIHLYFTLGAEEYGFTITSDNLNLKGLKTPNVEKAAEDATDEIEGMILEKLYLDRKIHGVVDKFFGAFLDIRLSDEWGNTLDGVRGWIKKEVVG